MVYRKGNYTACIWVLRFLGLHGGGRGRKGKSLMHLESARKKEKEELAKSKTKSVLDKVWGNTHFRKLSP